MECACCDKEGVMYMHGRCHPESPTWAIFHPDGLLTIVCAECDKVIVRFDATMRK